MEICFTYNGKKHCLVIPLYEIPVVVIPRPHPENYYRLLSDASLVASIQAAASKISDSKASEAIYNGVNTAIKAMQTHAGEGVEIHATARQ